MIGQRGQSALYCDDTYRSQPPVVANSDAFSPRGIGFGGKRPDGQCQLLTKGGPEAVFAKCTHFESEGETFEMEPILVGDLLEQVNSLNEDGLRVLAIATKRSKSNLPIPKPMNAILC